MRKIVKKKWSKELNLTALDQYENQIMVDKFRRVRNNDPDALREALNYGPVGVILNGDNRSFLFYRRGILNSKNCKPIMNHAVVAIGYGTDSKG